MNGLTGVPVSQTHLIEAHIGKKYPDRPGFVQMKCDYCPEMMWIGPRQQELKQRQEAEGQTVTVICPLCMRKHLPDFALKDLGG